LPAGSLSNRASNSPPRSPILSSPGTSWGPRGVNARRRRRAASRRHPARNIYDGARIVSVPLPRDGRLEPSYCWLGIAQRESADVAAALISQSCAEGNVDPLGLVLHSDNGTAMRGSTMISTLQWLGIVPSFSRPQVSDDNPYSEALFRTLKHTPAYPRLPFADLVSANRWVARFVAWYNGTHRHSAIRYVTPDQRHHGRDRAVLAGRHQLYERMRRANPERWSGATRNWLPVGPVVLNPQRAPHRAAA
jgi:transposase InsO family protein